MYRRFARAWAPVVGEVFVPRVFRAHVPLMLFAITILISWGVTLVKYAFANPNPMIFGSVNITVFLASFVELIVWVLLLASLRRDIANRLTSAGIKISSEPRILSPSRFLRWCLDQGFSREQAVAALSVSATQP